MRAILWRSNAAHHRKLGLHKISNVVPPAEFMMPLPSNPPNTAMRIAAAAVLWFHLTSYHPAGAGGAASFAFHPLRPLLLPPPTAPLSRRCRHRHRHRRIVSMPYTNANDGGVEGFVASSATATAPTVPPPPRPPVMTDAELLDLISSDAYAMDISSITAGSEKETYIGQGSGVNDGIGIGALSSWLKSAIGRILAYRNRPVYEKLWTIIENDLLAMVRERVPELTSRPTWFDVSDASGSPYSFGTDDGTCDGTVSAYRGGRVDWLTTCRFFSRTLGFGNMRIDGWSTRFVFVLCFL
jgi:hypothetical protein